MVWRRYTRVWHEMLIANWQLWVPAQLVNFAMVPLPFQVGSGLPRMAPSLTSGPYSLAHCICF